MTCGITKLKESKQTNHQKGVHQVRRFICDKCNFQSNSTSDLKDHKVVIHSNFTFSYRCEKCNFEVDTLVVVVSVSLTTK